MFRFTTSDGSVLEAHAQTDRALHELDAAIRAAFEHYEELARLLEAHDRAFDAARSHLWRAGYLNADRASVNGDAPAPTGPPKLSAGTVGTRRPATRSGLPQAHRPRLAAL